jgi:hypothetical protein
MSEETNGKNLEHKSRVVYSCGHTGETVIGNLIEVKTITRDYIHAIDIMTVCENCLIWYRKNGLIIDTDEQRERWLKRIQ